ncbi:acyl carrier protein [Kitasatospora sp. NPDC048540]|uniref:acyl carrier protein n=1 Tax=unclassified Kitasatospora TaxID=2633591 RepID=UPI00053B5CBA|nr:acyl carrier protein [Kitasatospora sp. MBT63]
MSESIATIELLRSLPRSERREALESLVVTEFKASLLMDEDEYLPTDESWFQLGFTSLRIVEVKTRLEAQLGIAVSTTTLFNSPTIDQLLDHLTGDLLGDLFDELPAGSGSL